MKINVIVCEYNPLHNGHLYLLEKSKSLHPDCYTVCIMSGNFVQRGEAAILDKWQRTKWALTAGADIVIELPTFFALQTADKFAFGAMKIASQLCDQGFISFGSETDDITLLKDIAKTILPQNSEFTDKLQTYLTGNIPFAIARQNAIIDCLADKYDKQLLKDTISSSNCILAIEYIKALYILNSNLKPNAVLRIDSAYNDKELSGSFSSATAIREAVKNEYDISQTVPDYVLKDLNNCTLSYSSYFDNIILYKLRTMPNYLLSDILEVKEGIENLLIKAASRYNTLDDLTAHATNKRYTTSRIKRICYYILLDITRQKYQYFNDKDAPIYARVLGFKKEAQPLLKHIKEHSKIPLITSVKDGMENKEISPLLGLDTTATDIYSLSLAGQSSHSKRDYTNKIIVK